MAVVAVGSDLSRSSLLYAGLVAGVILGVLKEANKPRPWPFICRRQAAGRTCQLRPLTPDDRKVLSDFLAAKTQMES
jgi:hypothetical protein